MSSLIILDRDGVVNEMVVNSDHGTIDSPLNVSEVNIIDGVPEALLLLKRAGFSFCIATNQPSAAKGKTSRQNLEAVHSKILSTLDSFGIEILSSHICYHRSEDQCECRKPKDGLLRAAFSLHPDFEPTQSWMVGDGVTDVQAGASLGLRTAFLGPEKWDAKAVFEKLNINPSFWGKNLLSFAEFINKKGKP